MQNQFLSEFQDAALEILAYQKRWKANRDKLNEKHKRSKEKGTGKAGDASGADGVSGNGQGADGDQLSA